MTNVPLKFEISSARAFSAHLMIARFCVVKFSVAKGEIDRLVFEALRKADTARLPFPQPSSPSGPIIFASPRAPWTPAWTAGP